MLPYNIMVPGSSSERHPLKFHHIHGENVRLTQNQRMATRTFSYCKALAFSDRAIAVDEIVCVRFTEVKTSWSGVLRIGVTNTDPTTFGANLPKYACPDMTSKEGSWAKAMVDRYCQQGNIMHFFVRDNGEMYYGVNGTLKGLFLSGINTRLPVYVVIDIYGNTTTVEFVDKDEVPQLRGLQLQPKPRPVPPPPQRVVSPVSAPTPSLSSHSNSAPVLNNAASSAASIATSSASNLPPAQPAQPPQRDNVALLTRDLEQRLRFGRQRHELLIGGTSSVAAVSAATSQPPSVGDGTLPRRTSVSPTHSSSLRYNSNVPICPLNFHVVHGPTITLSSDRTIARRSEDQYCRGYVFTSRPIKPYEKVVIQILKTQASYSGLMGFGVTNCDPLQLSNYQFPDDANDLMERLEFWVVHKIGPSPSELDELTFYINENGEIWFKSNDGQPRILMHVDASLSYYMFFDVYGIVETIRCVGCTDARLQVQQPPVQVPIIPQRQERRTPAHVAASSRRESAPITAAPQISPAAQRRRQAQISAALMQQQQRAAGLTVNLPPPQVPGRPDRMISSVSSSTNPTATMPPRAAAPPSAQMRPGRPPPPAPPQRTQSVPTAEAMAAAQQTAHAPAQQQRPASTSGVSNDQNQPATTSSDQGGSRTALDIECSICMNNTANCLVYPCGHVCMCYDCGRMTWSRQGQCPICRTAIKDIVRMYVQ